MFCPNELYPQTSSECFSTTEKKIFRSEVLDRRWWFYVWFKEKFKIFIYFVICLEYLFMQLNNFMEIILHKQPVKTQTISLNFHMLDLKFFLSQSNAFDWTWAPITTFQFGLVLIPNIFSFRLSTKILILSIFRLS